MKIGRAPKGHSSSKHQFSGAKMLVLGRVPSSLGIILGMIFLGGCSSFILCLAILGTSTKGGKMILQTSPRKGYVIFFEGNILKKIFETKILKSGSGNFENQTQMVEMGFPMISTNFGSGIGTPHYTTKMGQKLRCQTQISMASKGL